MEREPARTVARCCVCGVTLTAFNVGYVDNLDNTKYHMCSGCVEEAQSRLRAFTSLLDAKVHSLGGGLYDK